MSQDVNHLHATSVAIIGGGPSGLMAAEVLSLHGVQVHVYDAMPSVGRKFLLAGKGGMNITHAEPSDQFLKRYGSRQAQLEPLLKNFDAAALRNWVHELGIQTFVGSSNRVFPADMKAAPLLRAWLHRLRTQGVQFHMRHRWLGWRSLNTRQLDFATADGTKTVNADAVILALGGASWARLGSDGAWQPWLAGRGVNVAPLLPSNCGFDVPWSEHFRSRFAGQPVKSITLSWQEIDGSHHSRQGELVISSTGIEGSLIYVASAALREQIAVNGSVTVHLDLAPGRSLDRVSEEVSYPRGSRSMASHLQSRLKIAGVKAGLLHECLNKDEFADLQRLAQAIKALPLKLIAARPIDEAISSAGGVTFESLDERLMIRCLPGIFCAGEMLDWEAPTGGYLLTACFATGRAAAHGALAWLNQQRDE